MQQIFPHYPINLLIDNLRQTRSVSVTSNNILEGLLPFEEPNIIEESSQMNRTISDVTEASTSTAAYSPTQENEYV